MRYLSNRVIVRVFPKISVTVNASFVQAAIGAVYHFNMRNY